MDAAYRCLYLYPLLGTDILLTARPHSLNSGRQHSLPLAIRPRLVTSRMGRERLVSYLIYAVIGYSLIELNNRFGIIRMRASMQTAIYFLLVTICPEMHLLYAGDIAALAFLFSIYFLFKSYQQPQAAGYLFYSFLFIGAGSLLFPQLTFLSVLWIFEAHRFQALKPRSFCGALLGWVLP